MTKSYKGLNQSLVGELQKSRTNSFSEIGRIVDFYCVSAFSFPFFRAFQFPLGELSLFW